MPPIDTALARVQVAASQAGPFVDVGMVRSFDYTEGSENDTTLRWFGGEAAKAGDATLNGTFPVWFDREDTEGQEVVRAAKRSGTPVWLQVCPEGTATGKAVEQFEAVITEFSISADSEGDAVEGSFSYRGTPSTLTTVTLA